MKLSRTTIVYAVGLCLPYLVFGVEFSDQDQVPEPDGTQLALMQGQGKSQGKSQGQRKVPTSLVKGQDCTTADCHGALVKGNFVHGPVAIKRCTICHEMPDRVQHKFKTEASTAKVCLTCHEILLFGNVHQPIKEGNCTGCHDPHHSDNRLLLKERTQSLTCARCHDAGKGDKLVMHGPVAKGDCNLCHRAHSSNVAKLLTKDSRRLCLGCHEDIATAIGSSMVVHKPVGESCTTCHDPHGSDHLNLLKESRPKLCLDCHKTERDQLAEAKVFHGPLTSNDSCTSCHASHGSRYPKLLNEPVIDLCMKCHHKPAMRKDGTFVKGMGQDLDGKKFLHGPIREGDCTGCHNPHGGKHFSLLRESYPKQFYIPFNKKRYRLCFGCHEAAAFTSKTTKTLTKFRNGDQNLHFLHVNRDKKGRTCRACHETHGSNLPKHIAAEVPFGNWPLPIGFEQRPTGGACSPGCHKPRAYDTVKPVDYKLLRDKEKSSR